MARFSVETLTSLASPLGRIPEMLRGLPLKPWLISLMPPPMPLKKRAISVAKEAGLLGGVGIAALLGIALALNNPEASSPRLVLSFEEPQTSTHEGEGKTGAHGPAKTPQEIEDQRFLEAGPHGQLPRIADDGTLPANYFARATPPPGARPVISVIVTGLGLDREASLLAIENLPPEITLAFSPYSTHLPELAERSREATHEFMIEVPLEPFDFPESDPGPLTLLVNAPQLTNLDRLHHSMGRVQGFTGILTTGRSRFAISEPALKPIVHEAMERGIIILDDGRAPISKMPRIARQTGAYAGIVDRRLDDRPTADGLALALIELERLAIEQGRAIGAMELFPIAISRLSRWRATLNRKGIILAPVSLQILPAPALELEASDKKASDEKPPAEHH